MQQVSNCLRLAASGRALFAPGPHLVIHPAQPAQCHSLCLQQTGSSERSKSMGCSISRVCCAGAAAEPMCQHHAIHGEVVIESSLNMMSMRVQLGLHTRG